MESYNDLKLAVLIDADNVPYVYVKEMFEEIAKYGTPTFKRIYADWTKPTVSGWKKVLLENAITPIQQYSYSKGKNSSDSALIIDAMDILYTGKVDGFCIVSSDSDFTRLATRLREAGMKVIGIGEKKTLAPFITACDKFIYIEILKKERESQPEPDNREPSKTAPEPAAGPLNKIDPAIIKLISDSITDLADENGWTYLGDLGSLIIKKKPDFDPRNYGFAKMSPMIRSINLFEIDERDTGKKNVKHIYIRKK
ncbi:NYN domain-containing protein [Mucilaginibacter ginsenosidivorans]|uniref:NYN domain-containing protein n=1 Tax=Mucilaginibacter ginsenosidivorans TaxID=398053 RepID=A0A5B8UX76_9SPHI|nr:NYN domain-containing protein [Mucilaginibacter ginsenosidivorans]QEC63654.1 NYN domain-containing protein [Mucilaginibacter ginsenosidivorans]